MQHAMLIAQEISKTFTQGKEHITVLDNINCIFTQEKSYAITGISGSGKSTLIHILAGLDTPTTGTVLYNNVSLFIRQSLAESPLKPWRNRDKGGQTLSPSLYEQFLNKSIGLVFQSPHLIRELSVIENIILPGLISGIAKNDCETKALELLKKVELCSKKDSKIGELSGGQQQRVAIARALFNNPTFLIADEPTGNLDLATGKTIIDLLLSCKQEWGMGIIISSHDEYVAEKMDEVYKLENGKLNKI